MNAENPDQKYTLAATFTAGSVLIRVFCDYLRPIPVLVNQQGVVGGLDPNRAVIQFVTVDKDLDQ